MTQKLNDAQSYHLGWGVAGEYARTLDIAAICAIFLQVLPVLGESWRNLVKLQEVPENVLEADYRRGFDEGLRAACGQIMREVDTQRGLR